jgi:hypothetical protein
VHACLGQVWAKHVTAADDTTPKPSCSVLAQCKCCVWCVSSLPTPTCLSRTCLVCSGLHLSTQYLVHLKTRSFMLRMQCTSRPHSARRLRICASMLVHKLGLSCHWSRAKQHRSHDSASSFTAHRIKHTNGRRYPARRTLRVRLSRCTPMMLARRALWRVWTSFCIAPAFTVLAWRITEHYVFRIERVIANLHCLSALV